MDTQFKRRPQAATGVLLASLVLPGLAALSAIAPSTAAAENPPEKNTVGVNYSTYSDGQPGWDRIRVHSPQVYVQAPLAAAWAVEGSWVGDSISGATPRMHTQRATASNMSDERNAGDVKVTRYMSRAAVSASVAYSDEHDYTSRTLGLGARWSTDDNNRTWSAGYAHSSDKIDNTSTGVNTAINQHKRTGEFMGGVTQVLTPIDIVQANLTRSIGKGYYNDPYKLFDLRPDERNSWIGLVRWNHYLQQPDASLQTSYRYYTDTFGIRSHTLSLDWVQPVGRWTFTPGGRYATQSAADFYLNPIVNAQGQYDLLANVLNASHVTGNKSLDQRLAAFGALTLSIKVSYAFTPDLMIDGKFETYRQTAGLRLGGSGSPDLDAFHARTMQIGLTRRF